MPTPYNDLLFASLASMPDVRLLVHFRDGALESHPWSADLTRQGHTILMTSHDLDRGVAVANRVAILASGRLAYAADCASLAPGELAAAYAAASHAAGAGA